MKTLIKNIKIYDGTGEKPYVSDVLVSGDKIEKIAKEIKCENAEVIDGTGLCLSSGFIDTHTHSDAQLFIDPDRKEKLRMGVTAEIGGQCGWSRAPLLPDAPEAAVSYIHSVYGPKTPDFTTFKEFVDVMEKKEIGAHQMCFVGHQYIRGSVVGMDDRAATQKELDKMCGLVEEAMQAGARGFSVGLVYAPGIYSTKNELVAIAKTVARYGGMFTSHIRNESNHVLDAVKEVIDVSMEAGVPLNISHMKAMFPQNWHYYEDILDLIDKSIAEGADITFDVYPYEASSATILSTLPPSYNSHGTDWLVEHLTGEENINILEKAMMEPTEEFENPFKNIGPDKMLLSYGKNTPDAIGKTIKEYADFKGIRPIEAYAEIIRENRGLAGDIRFNMSEEKIAMFYRHPKCLVGTDGLYNSGIRISHPRHFGTFPRYLGRFVRDMGVLSFEEGVSRLTGQAADRYGLKNKGYVKEGYDADLVIFDEKTIIDGATYMDQTIPNKGIKYVFVSGGIAVKDNEYTGLMNGKFIKYKGL